MIDPVYLHVIVVVIGAVLGAIALVNITGAFAIWCALYPLVAQLTPVRGLEVLPASRIVTAILFAVALIHLRKSKHVASIPVWRRYVLFLATLLVASLLAAQKGASLARTLTFIEPAMWGVIAYTSMQRAHNASQRILGGLIAGCIIVTAYGLLEFAIQRNVLTDIGVYTADARYIDEKRFLGRGRISSTLTQPVYTSLYLLFILPLVIYRSRRARSAAARVTLWVFAGAVVFAILATGSRTALVGLLLIPPGFAYFSRHRWKAVSYLLLAYALVPLAVLLFLPDEYIRYLRESMRPGTAESANVIGRLELTVRLWNLVQGNLTFGLGPGFVQRMASTRVDYYRGLGGVENQYFTLLAEAGLVGLMAYLLFLVGAFSLTRRVHSLGDGPAREWAAPAGTILLTVVVLAITVSLANLPVMSIPFVCLGVIAATRMQKSATSIETISRA